MIKVSAPGKIHLLGEHSIVYGKPALLATVDLRVTVILKPWTYNDTIVHMYGVVKKVKKTVEDVVKTYLKLKAIPPYNLEISSQLPIGAGLGSSAAISSSFIAALLSLLKVKWDLNLVNSLAFEAEKEFHGNPSGADNSTIVYGGLVWYRKETPDLKIIQKLPFSIFPKLAKNFVLINTGTPKETTKQMITMTQALFAKRPKLKDTFLTAQEKLVRELLPTLKDGNEKELIRIIRTGEKNLESIDVVSSFAKNIIKKIENIGGAAKICGAGGKAGPTGILLTYHQDKNKLEEIAKSFNLPFFSTRLGVEGIRQES
ncbi:mevalonate kinase [Candidatus Daviesbacteria bacterium]|nr:mevalonate kinase [Candidatus Daviesbacteria bacterium]